MIDSIRKQAKETKITLLNSDYEQTKLELTKRFKSATTILSLQEREVVSEIKMYIAQLVISVVISKIKNKVGYEAQLDSYLQNSFAMIGTPPSTVVESTT